MSTPHYLSSLLADALDRLTADRCTILFNSLGQLPQGLAFDLLVALIDEATSRRELVDAEFTELVDDDDE